MSLPSDVLDAARKAVRDGRADSLSGYVAAALAEKHDRHALDAVLAAMAADDGEPTEEDLEWVRQVMDRSSSTPAH